MNAKTTPKSTTNGRHNEKAPSIAGKNAPSIAGVKAPSYYIPREYLSCVDGDGLRVLLHNLHQCEWCTDKRIAGLLSLIDFTARYGRKVSISCELSRDYVSDIKRPKNSRTIRQPLAVLVHIGIFQMEPAVVAPHVKQSAKYWLNPEVGKLRQIKVHITPKQQANAENAENRKNARLNKKHRTRAQILADLKTVALSEGGQSLAFKMLIEKSKEPNVRQLMNGLEDKSSHKVTYDRSGTIRHLVMRCPRELKPHLTMSGNPVAIVDMKSAHLCALLCVVNGRKEWRTRKAFDTSVLEAESAKLKAILERGDIYTHLADGKDRETIKKGLLSSLNMETRKAVHIPAYSQFKKQFPSITGIIEDLNKYNHKVLGAQLRNYTARIIEKATHSAQQLGITCLPDTDALIVPATCEKEARRILNEAIYEQTGLRFPDPPAEP